MFSLNFPSQFYSRSHFRQHQYSVQHCVHHRRGANPGPLHGYAPELQREGHCHRGARGQAHSRGKCPQKCPRHGMMRYHLPTIIGCPKGYFFRSRSQMSFADLSIFLHRRACPLFPSKRIQVFFHSVQHQDQ